MVKVLVIYVLEEEYSVEFWFEALRDEGLLGVS
jgi:hypothetical protein